MTQQAENADRAYQDRLIGSNTGKMALFLGITFGMLIVLDNMLPGTGVLLSISVLLVYLFHTRATDWIVQFFAWLTGLTK